MSTSSVSLNSSLQNLATSLVDEINSTSSSSITYDDFAAFLESYIKGISGTSEGTDQSGTASKKTTTSSASSTTSDTSTAYQNRLLGFDLSRIQSAAGTLKYDAAKIMEVIDPSNSTAMQTAYAKLAALHPGEVSLDADGNLMLNGTADGYIGIRPMDRSDDWSNPASGYAWQWMAYNDAHPGPNGETS